MNLTDRAEQALYASLDCGGSKALRARANIHRRLQLGKTPRRRDIHTLEDAARLAGSTVAVWRMPPRSRRRLPAAFWRDGLAMVGLVLVSIAGGAAFVWLAGLILRAFGLLP